MSAENYWAFAGDHYAIGFLVALILFGILNPEGENGFIWIILFALFWPIVTPIFILTAPLLAILATIEFIKGKVFGNGKET